MPRIELELELPPWPDLDPARVVEYDGPIRMTALPGAMSSGATAILIRLDLPTGPLMVETSLAVLAAAVRGIAARYEPGLFESPPPTAEVAWAALLGIVGMSGIGNGIQATSLFGANGEVETHVAVAGPTGAAINISLPGANLTAGLEAASLATLDRLNPPTDSGNGHT